MPTGNPGEWVTSNDYPTKALREEAAGVTAFRLTIGTGGMVAGCAITASSGSQELDDATCQLITQRALFSPARNANGEPVTGQYSNRVRWVLPASSSPNASVQLANLNRVVTFFVETDGTVTQCRITVDGVDYSARSDSFCKTQRHYAPFRDALGNPVRRKVTITSIARITDPDGKPRPPRMKRRR